MNNYTNTEVQDTVTPIACCQAGECRTIAKHPHTYRAPVDVFEAEDRFIVLADMPGTTPLLDATRLRTAASAIRPAQCVQFQY